MLVGKPYYQNYFNALAPVRGQNKPRSQVGFDIFPVRKWGHIDTILVAPDRNPFYDSFLDWLYEWSEDSVQIPKFEF
jgi:hypothetical protein